MTGDDVTVPAPGGDPGWIEVPTLGDMLLRTAASRPDHDALVIADERYTYAEVAERSIEAAAALDALGVQRGEHVGLLLPNCAELVFAFFGAQLLGAVVVPFNTRFRSHELRHVLADSDVVTLVTSDRIDAHVDLLGRLEESVPGLAEARDPWSLELAAVPRLRNVACLGSRTAPWVVPAGSARELAAGVDRDEVLARRVGVAVRRPAVIAYTSGTTQQPKGCILTHEALYRPWTAFRRRVGITAEDRLWNPLALGNMGGISTLVFCFDVGVTLVSMEHFDPGEALELLERERVTWLYPGFGHVAMNLVDHPAFASTDLSHLKGLHVTGPPGMLATVQDAFPGVVQVTGFGSTETGGVVSAADPADPPEVRASTCGRPLPGVEVRIVDPDSGAVAAPGEPGEILVRSPGLLEGYHRDAEKTAACLLPGGWLRTGDIGTVAADGHLRYVARLKDMLRVGGQNVAAAEVESLLAQHPAVKLAQVVGLPDDRLGEVPVAFVELRSGVGVEPEEIIRHCEGRIAAFKVPRHVRFVSEWPMSVTKIQKFRLRQLLVDELAAASPP